MGVISGSSNLRHPLRYIDGLAYWGLLDGPGGSRKEGRKEVEEKYPRGVFIRKYHNAKSHHRVDIGMVCWGFWLGAAGHSGDGMVTGCLRHRA